MNQYNRAAACFSSILSRVQAAMMQSPQGYAAALSRKSKFLHHHHPLLLSHGPENISFA